jgi:hypothetical protein
MYRITLAVAGLFISAGSVPALAGHGGGAGASGNCEMARVNARAGGPTNGYDAWLLETCGCEPGTKNAFCERLNGHRQEPGSYHQNRHHKGTTTD